MEDILRVQSGLFALPSAPGLLIIENLSVYI